MKDRNLSRLDKELIPREIILWEMSTNQNQVLLWDAIENALNNFAFIQFKGHLIS